MHLYKVYCKQRSEHKDHHTDIENTEGVFRKVGGGSARVGALQAQWLEFFYRGGNSVP